ncbi:inner nuclear membrane protein enriched at telomere/subtelomere region [Candidozyma auris]|uniref:Inner nuclear membrane protein SRC1 n=1 Tax=Candidozyma auris TaxID=498019 RepID=A0A2H0ZWH0_CANAR|nr:hypothetical protein B9J08_002137 [[Candida] auris]PIS56396.1 hypothetical protein CJI97_001644 [[Candida] auris]
MEKDYLSNDFDPSRIKVAQLRSILRENDIEYPSGAKKKELVEIFTKNIDSIKSKGLPPIEPSPTPNSDEIEVIDSEPEEKPASKEATPTKNTRKPRKVSKAKENGEETNNLKHESDSSVASDVSVSDNEKITDNTPDVTQNSDIKSLPSSSTKKKSKKRKSSAFEDDEHSKAPQRGNIFQVDVDSDSDTVIFSPKPKKLKPSSPKPESPKLKVRNTPDERNRSQSKRSSLSPSEIAKSSYQDVKNNLNITPSKSAGIPKKETVPRKQPFVKEEVTRPILDPVPDSTTDVSRDETNDSSKKLGDSFKDDFEDDAKNFDTALSKLKGDVSHSKETDGGRKDEEIAKLLGVDVEGVKVKPKGRRVITPRRPIVISERRLASNRGSLLEDLEKDVVPVPSDIPIEKETISTLSDEEADTDIEDEADGPKDVMPEKKSRSHSSKKSKKWTTSLYIGLWVSILAFAMFGYWYREQTFLIGYCGHEIDKPTIPKGSDTSALLNVFGDYLDNNFKPTCVPCPQHARCFPHLKLACYEDFVEYKPWYYDYWPAFDPKAKKCIPDTKKAEKVELMIEEALDLLRARNANIQCGSTSVDNFEAGIESRELHDLLLALKAPYITEEEFEELWKRSVVELEKEPEITVKRSAHNLRAPGDDADTVGEEEKQDTVFRSTSLSHISLMCHLSNHMVDLLVSYIPHFMVVLLVVIMTFVIRAKHREARLQAHRVETLYNEVLSKLRKQARNARDSENVPAYIGSIHLRDLILSNEKNSARKMRTWEAVSRKVSRNTNVKAYQLEYRGDIMKVWEWISHLD